MGFYEYLVKRLVYSSVTLFLVSIVIFILTQALPGSAAEMILGPRATETNVEIIREQLGLNRPLHVQYIDWITSFLTGDWGYSYISKAPIDEVVIPRLIRSLQLAAIAILLIALIGITAGVVAAFYQNTKLDQFITISSYVGISAPGFVVGILLIMLFAGPVFNVFPQSGYVPPSEGIVPWFKRLILPSITLSIIGTAHTLRQTRSGMIEALQSEYVRTARLKGLPEREVIGAHALRNGLISTVTVLALALGWLMGSIVVIEEVFAYPGLGRLVFTAVQTRDIPLVQVTVLIIAATYTFANLGADIVYTYLDPRIEYE